MSNLKINFSGYGLWDDRFSTSTSHFVMYYLTPRSPEGKKECFAFTTKQDFNYLPISALRKYRAIQLYSHASEKLSSMTKVKRVDCIEYD